MRTHQFFVSHPVFTIDELDRFLGDTCSRPRARASLLTYHRRRGNIERIRRGLYATISSEFRPDSQPVDLFLVAVRLVKDGVLAYHTALEFHGVSQSLREEFVVISRHAVIRPLLFRGARFRAVHPPEALGEQALLVGVEGQDRHGEDLRVTTLERTLVDVLDRPALGGGWEEIWRSFEAVPYLDLKQVVQYTLLLNNATLAALVGFFLEQHRERLMVEDSHLLTLWKRRPRTPHYLSRGQGRLVARWNLIVPEPLLERPFEEAP